MTTLDQVFTQAQTETLSKFREKITNEEPSLLIPPDEFLGKFLVFTKFDLEKAFDRIKRYYTIRKTLRKYYEELNYAYVISLFQCERSQSILPSTDNEGRLIYYGYLGHDLSVIKTKQELTWICLLMFEYLTHRSESQTSGITVIGDCSNLSFKHQLMYLTLLKVLLPFLTQAIPVKLKLLNAVNENIFFYPILNLAIYLLPKKLRERVFVHGNNYEVLHRFIDPSSLPMGTGGTGPIDKSKFIKDLIAFQPEFERSLKYGYIE